MTHSAEKPENSKVLLTIESDFLEVKTPRSNRISQILFELFFVFLCGCPLFIVCFGLYWANWEDKLTILFWSLPLWYFGASLFKALPSILFTDRPEYEYFLHLDRHQVYLVDTMSSNPQQPANPTSTIHKIELIPESTRVISRFGEREVDLTLAELVIWADQEKYRIRASYGHLTEAELKWLATEIGAWLNLPITQARTV